MEELLPDIIIKTKTDSKSFLKCLYKIAKVKASVYKSKYENDYIITDSDYLEVKPSKQNGHKNIIAQIFTVPEKENIVQVEIRAMHWKVEPVTYENYVTEARRILIPLLADYNKKYNLRKRLSIQSKESLLKNLPPLANKKFMTFVHHANKNILHPLDWNRFYVFIRHCYAKKVSLYPGELMRMLINNGFDEKKAEYLSDIFSHGIKLLGTY